MKFEQYIKFVEAGVILEARHDLGRERLMLAGMGLAGEAGETCDHIKKVAFHGVKMDRDKLLKEMGDVLWYYALLAGFYDMTLDEIMEANVYKLCDRYPHLHGDPDDVIVGKTV